MGPPRAADVGPVVAREAVGAAVGRWPARTLPVVLLVEHVALVAVPATTAAAETDRAAAVAATAVKRLVVVPDGIVLVVPAVADRGAGGHVE